MRVLWARNGSLLCLLMFCDQDSFGVSCVETQPGYPKILLVPVLYCTVVPGLIFFVLCLTTGTTRQLHVAFTAWWYEYCSALYYALAQWTVGTAFIPTVPVVLHNGLPVPQQLNFLAACFDHFIVSSLRCLTLVLNVSVFICLAVRLLQHLK